MKIRSVALSGPKNHWAQRLALMCAHIMRTFALIRAGFALWAQLCAILNSLIALNHNRAHLCTYAHLILRHNKIAPSCAQNANSAQTSAIERKCFRSGAVVRSEIFGVMIIINERNLLQNWAQLSTILRSFLPCLIALFNPYAFISMKLWLSKNIL